MNNPTSTLVINSMNVSESGNSPEDSEESLPYLKIDNYPDYVR